ncbi:hypothetical protein PG991_016229 [Apiospora marii]|uniref:Thioesterase family protein n=1 Tax=Apiospora marii TaxID=335849 RepID=A0ABR1R146_9PEZI
MAATKGTVVPFSEATSVTKLDANTYKCFLQDAYCVGAVPNGGYVASCMLAAARVHLTPRGQPDTLTAHFEFPDRTFAGPAVISVDEVNIGQQLSRLHLTLWQGGLLSQVPWIDSQTSRRAVLAYTTHTNLQTFTGISLPTGYEGTDAAALPPLPDFEALKARVRDGTWEEPEIPKHVSTLMRSLQNWHFYIPQKEPFSPGVLDMWIRLASGEPITQAALAYVVDSFPYNMHTFLAAPEIRQLLQSQPDPQGETEEKRAQRAEVKERDEGRAALWFPTVVMNLEAKTALPAEGVEWLAARVTSKQIKDGRFDLDILVRDVDGELVALSHHVAMIVSVERNTKKMGVSSKASL